MVALKPLHDLSRPMPYQKFVFVHVIFPQLVKTDEKAPFLEPQDHARMKDLKIPVLTVALKPLYDFSRHSSCQKFVFSSRVCLHVLKKKGYTATFLEPQDHARMKDLKLPVLMGGTKTSARFYTDPFRTKSSFSFHVLFHMF